MITNLLSIPPTLQDMVIHMVTTATMGYTILLHIELFGIFPLLAFGPFLVVCVIVHFYLQSQRVSANQRLAKLFPTPATTPASSPRTVTVRDENSETPTTTIATKSVHVTRRQSVQHAMSIAEQISNVHHTHAQQENQQLHTQCMDIKCIREVVSSGEEKCGSLLSKAMVSEEDSVSSEELISKHRLMFAVQDDEEEDEEEEKEMENEIDVTNTAMLTTQTLRNENNNISTHDTNRSSRRDRSCSDDMSSVDESDDEDGEHDLSDDSEDDDCSLSMDLEDEGEGDDQDDE
jgi:hypothetical protein